MMPCDAPNTGADIMVDDCRSSGESREDHRSKGTKVPEALHQRMVGAGGPRNGNTGAPLSLFGSLMFATSLGSISGETKLSCCKARLLLTSMCRGFFAALPPDGRPSWRALAKAPACKALCGIFLLRSAAWTGEPKRPLNWQHSWPVGFGPGLPSSGHGCIPGCDWPQHGKTFVALSLMVRTRIAP